ncbi:MAG: FAD-dependent oxidoreductase, partial [Verrucomicrobiae bacterium]|nr:FAD-dependent oxidoreductase [Verrucomicrobiae bacterium]
RRQEIHAATVGYIQGFLHFLATDPRVPVNVREEMQSWGYCRDEFQDSGGFGHQMYVREARRMVSDYVMTEHNARGQVVAPDPIGLGSYTMDSHNVQRVVQNGVVRNEGDVQVGVPAPYGIAYRSIVPARGECDNLFVTFCLSATHIAFGSARMEPVFMITSQSAATAAAFAIDDDVVVQDVDYVKLSAQLRADDQILSWGETGGAPEIVVDSVDPGALVMGDWLSSTSVAGYHGSDYLHDDNDGKGVKSVRFVPNLPEPGEYTVYLRWTAHANRATHVPVSINHDDGSVTVMVDQTANNGLWVALGTYRFTPGNGSGVLIETTGTTGYVIADAAGWSRDAPARPLVNLLSGDPRGTEGDPNDPIHYLFATDRELQEPLTVRYSIGGTSNGSDLQSALSGSLTIPVGRTTARLRVVPLDDDTVEGDETLVITLDSSPDYEQGDHTAVTGILHDEPFDAWRARRFSKEQLPEPGVAGETDDPDHDRVPNLAEFFGGGNPLVADEGPQMGIRLADGVVWVDLVRTREAGRLVITPEGGTTLGTLAPMAPTAPVMVFREGPLERLRFSMERFSGLTEPQRFYRFSLQHPAGSPTR